MQHDTQKISIDRINDIGVNSIGQDVVCNNLKYTIHGYKVTDRIGERMLNYFDGTVATGMFLLVEVSIENVGKDPEMFYETNIKIVNKKGQTFRHSFGAEEYLPGQGQLRYGLMKVGTIQTGQMVFDLPVNTKGVVMIESGDEPQAPERYINWN